MGIFGKKSIALVKADSSDRAERGGGRSLPIEPGFLQRLVQGVKYTIQGTGPEVWFGPQQPLTPVAPPEVKGRTWDYPVGYNLYITQRPYEGISFALMRGLADSYDILRLVIETRKDQIARMKWKISHRPGIGSNGGGPKKPTDQAKKHIDQVMEFLLFPDQEHNWDQWLRIVLEDMLVIDAATIYPRKTKGGQVYAFEPVDGATIVRKINSDGRTPEPPDVAYQQILKGLPAADYSRDQLIYFPRNLRSNHAYGYSAVEQVINIVNIGLRRMTSQMEYYRQGNIPEALIGVPKDWTVDQIAMFQAYWDDILEGNLAQRRHAKFVPGEMKIEKVREAPLKDDFDEWLARVVCYAFSVSPQPFIKEINRATAQSSAEMAQQEGLEPLLRWSKNLIDILLWKYFQFQDVEFAWEEEIEPDALKQAQINQIYITTGVLTAQQVAEGLGFDYTPEKEPEPEPAPGSAAKPKLDENGNVIEEPEPTRKLGKRGGGSHTALKTDPVEVETETLKIKLVDAAKIRDKEVDFTMGGNHWAWPEVAKEDEILIEEHQVKKDKVETISHEVTERSLMKYFGWSYDKAHDVASEVSTVIREALGKQGMDKVSQQDDLAKRKKKVNRIDRERDSVLKARRQFKKVVMGIFDKCKKHIHKINMAKMDAETEAIVKNILSELELNEFAVLQDPSEEILAAITKDGVYHALMQIGMSEDDMTEKMSSKALAYAQERAAELVGKRRLKDGTIIENPNRKWAIEDTTRDLLRGDVAKAVEEGWSTKKLQDELEKNFAFSEDRAEMIARTEIAFADMKGNAIVYKESGVVSGKEWLLASNHPQQDECDENVAAGVVDINADFPSGDGWAPSHPNCLVGNTIISAASISKHFKRWFEGEIIILSVPGMDDLSITPNHPVLTDHGWVAASLLKEGDNLVYCDSPEIFAQLANPDDYHMKTRIEDIGRSLLVSGGVSSYCVPSSPIDFHGDGTINSEVSIIGTNGLLGNDKKLLPEQCLIYLALTSGHPMRSRLNPDSTAAKLLEGLLFSSDGIMGSLSAKRPDFSRSLRHFNQHRFTLGPDLQAASVENIAQGGTMTSQFSRQFNAGFPLEVTGVNSGDLRIRKSPTKFGTFLSISDDETSLNESPVDSMVTYSHPICNLLNALSGKIRLVKISKVIKENFAGHVFNLQTRDNYYIAQNLIVSNCLCDTLPVLAEED